MNCFHLSYLWTTDNNWREIRFIVNLVVNCFHLSYLWTTDNNWCTHISPCLLLWIAFIYRIFEPLTTTISISKNISSLLWIAFIYRIFEPLTTTPEQRTESQKCCELLSFIVSLNHWQQQYLIMRKQLMLWIAFIYRIFEPLTTTITLIRIFEDVLWIAFIYRIFEPLTTTGYE